MDFSISPYYDDFENKNGAKENNYMRILFKPGYAVQARELTQIQSILQNQIKSFGDHIFQDGSPVQGGHLTFDNNVKSLKINAKQGNTSIVLSDFSNKLIINSTGSATKRAKVVAIDNSIESSTLAGALLVRTLTGKQFANGDSIKIATTLQEATISSDSGVGRGSVVSINDGIFYVDGYFVYVPPQTIVLDSESTTPSYKVGLQIEDHYINYTQDSMLLDPAQEAFNYQAPGADRYQFKLVLSKRKINDIVDESKFFELLRIENGIITKQVKYPIYSEIEKTLARRTYDESGDYTVNPFRISVADDLNDDDKYVINIEPGKAYVKGFEFETIATQPVTNDKARTTASSKNYDLNLEYGNYVVVTNLFSGNTGLANVSGFATLDLHTVSSANINTYSEAAYVNTKIGTAKIRNIEYAGDNNYFVYLTDINTSPRIITSLSGVYTNSIVFGADFAASAFLPEEPNAYANVEIKILSGPASGEIRRVVSYTPDPPTIFLDRPLNNPAGSGANVSFNFATKDIDSIVAPPQFIMGIATSDNVYATSNSTMGMLTCMDISASGREVSSGNTRVYLTEYNRMIHRLPESYISWNAMENMRFIHRKFLPSMSFVGGSKTISSGSELETWEKFNYGYTAANIPSNIAKNNILVMVKDKGSSTFANGEIIQFDSSNTVYQVSADQITIDAGLGTFSADVFVTVEIDNAESRIQREKELKGNSNITSLRTSDSPVYGQAVVGTANADTARIDTSNGYVWFTNYYDIPKKPGDKLSLFIPDVTKIIKIYDSGDPNTAPNVANGVIDVTNRYLFDGGQRDNYYDHGYITLRDGYNPPKGQIVVMLTYYNHTGASGGGFFNANSYPRSDFSRGIVPYYSSEKFGVMSLSDCIDFRPTRPIPLSIANSVSNFVLSGLKLPQPDFAMELDYEYYLGRIDKLVLSKDKQFKIVKGNPSVYPKTPMDSDDSMTLYIMKIPPYTSRVKDIQIQYIENRRYTMRDIGNLEKRISNLEYYTALNMLESQTTDMTVLYQDGTTAKDKYGIIVDKFDGFNVADNKSPDLICNLGDRTLTPFRDITPLDFIFNGSSGNHSVNDRTYSVAYSEEPCVVQNTATKSISVQPYAFGQFLGEISLYPETDYWYSKKIAPEVIAPPNDFVTVELPPSPPAIEETPPTNIDLINDVVPPIQNTQSSIVTDTGTTSTPVISGGDPQPPQQTSTINYCYSLPNLFINWYNGDSLYWQNSYYYGYNYYGSGLSGCYQAYPSPDGYGQIDQSVWMGQTASTQTNTVEQQPVTQPTNTGGSISVSGGGASRFEFYEHSLVNLK